MYSQLSECRPEIGSQPSSTPNRIMHKRASQKSGVAKPTKTNTVVTLSKGEYCRVALAIPMGMARATMIASSAMFSMSVTGRRSLILCKTGRPSGANERPKSRRASRPSQFQYCVTIGWSSPYISRRSCRA